MSPQDQDPPLEYSPFSQQVTRNGVSVSVQIYRTEDCGWILEIVDAEQTSHVWDDEFASDQQAFEEAMRAIEEEPLEFWPESSVSKTAH